MRRIDKEELDGWLARERRREAWAAAWVTAVVVAAGGTVVGAALGDGPWVAVCTALMMSLIAVGFIFAKRWDRV